MYMYITYLPSDHLIQQDTTTPPVCGETVRFPPQHLRGYVLRGASNSARLLGYLQHLGTAKIGQDYLAFL